MASLVPVLVLDTDLIGSEPTTPRARHRVSPACAYHVVDAPCYAPFMPTQVAIRLDDRDLAVLDAEVAEGRAVNRSDAVRRGIARLRRDQRYRGEEAVLVELARCGEPVYPELKGVLDLPHPPLD